MPIEITGAHPPEHRLKPGEVVMVKRKLIDKQTKKPFDWRFFALVLGAQRWRIVLYILDGKHREAPSTMSLAELGDPTQTQLWVLPEGEWPDGVHAFRTKLILEGRIEGVDELF